MRHTTSRYGLVCAGLFAFSLGSAGANDLRTADVLPDGRGCDHVIDLILQHGVNNSFEHARNRNLLPGPFGGWVVSEDPWGDLCLTGVHRIVHNDPACGPRFSVGIHNDSPRAVQGVHVTAVATLGSVFPSSPSKTVRLDRLGAGETATVEIQLPLDALAMGTRNGASIGFQRLVVAIDSLDRWCESNEANNLKAYSVAAIPNLAPVANPAANELPVPESVVRVENSVPPSVATPESGTLGPTQQPAPVADPLDTDDLRTALDQLPTETETSE